MITILPRTVSWLLAGFTLFSARGTDTASDPPATTEGEVRTLVQSLQLPRPRLLVRPGEWERLSAAWVLGDTTEARERWDSPNPGTVMAAFTAEAPLSGTFDLAAVFWPDGTTAGRLPAGSH